MKVLGVASVILALVFGIIALVQANDATDLSIANSKIDRASTRLSNCGVLFALGEEIGSTEHGAELLAQARSDRDEGRYEEAADKAEDAYFALGEAGCPSSIDPAAFDSRNGL